MMRILFLGTHGQKNWGDELLLKTFMDHLSPLAKTIYVNSYLPEDTRLYLSGYNVKVFHTSKDRLKLLSYIIRADALVFGGGSVLKELYVAYGGQRYATLRVIDTLTKVAKLAGRPIYFCNIGAGPVETKEGETITKGIVDRASYTTVRDSESLALLEKIKVTSGLELASDVVFSLSRGSFGLDPVKPKSKNAPLTIGVNLCRNIENNDNWQYFLDQLTHDIASWSKGQKNVRIVGIPMQASVSNNNDMAELENLKQAVRKLSPEVDFSVLRPTSIDDIAAAIDGCDLLLAERLHTLIMSTIIGTPLVALEYDVKVTSVMKDIGLSQYGVNINQQFKDGAIRKLIELVVDDVSGAKKDLAKAYTLAHQKSSRSVDDMVARLKSARK